jgi:signal transduction histidine kinase
MGIGLSICRSIVEAHGGRVWATANEEAGTTFSFTLSLSSDDMASQA